MSNLTELIKHFQSNIRKSSARQEYLDQILKELNSSLDKTRSCSYAAKTISILCQDVQKNQKDAENNLSAYTNFISKILPYMTDEKYEVFMLQNLKFFVYFLLSKNINIELRKFLEAFIIDKIICAEAYKLYFDMVKNVQFYCLQKDTQSQSAVDVECATKCFKNLKICMEVPSDETFLLFFTDLFNHESSYNTICKNHESAQEFNKFCFKRLQTISTIKNYDDFFMQTIKHFLFFNKYEVTLNMKSFCSIDLLKCVIANALIKTNVYHHYALNLLLYMSSLRTKAVSQANLKEILNKQNKLLETKETSDWYLDYHLTLIQFWQKNACFILNNISDENLKLFIIILNKLTKMLFKTSYVKSNCSSCRNFKAHDMINIFEIAVDAFEQNVQQDLNDEQIKILIPFILESIKKDYTSIAQCKYLKAAFRNKLSGLKKAISKIESSKLAVTALKIVDSFNSDSFVEDLKEKLVILRLYIHLYTITNERNHILQLYATILSHTDAENENINSFMFSFVKLQTELSMWKTTIKNMLDSCDKKFLYEKCAEKTDLKFLNRKQLELIVMYKLFTNDKIEELLEIIVETDALNMLDLTMIVRSLEQMIKSDKIQRKLNEIKIATEKCHKNDLEKHLILAHFYKYEALRQFENSRNCVTTKLSNEDSLMEIKIEDFKKINLITEYDVTKPALLSLKHFEQVYKLNETNNSKIVDLVAVIDDLSYLARSFRLRGYLDFAAHAWILVYYFADRNGENDLHKIRVISFFCRYIHFDLHAKFDINFNNEINVLSDKILEHYKNLKNLSPRRQNYVLLCLLDMAHYYAFMNDMESFRALVKMVQAQINNMEGRKHKFELVRAHLFALEFSVRLRKFAKLCVSPFMFACQILKELKNIVYITSEDSLNMSCFLIEFVEDISSYLLTMMDTKSITSYVMYVLTFSLQYGITFRIAKLFITWTKINLQNSDFSNMQLKLLILEKLLLEEDVGTSSVDKYFNAAIETKKTSTDLLINTSVPIEQARKAIQHVSSEDNNLLYPKTFEHNNFDKYLIDHKGKCGCSICKFPIYKFLIFDIGCCYFQMNFLKNRNALSSKICFERALQWWSKMDNESLKIYFQETLFYLYLEFIKCLRLNGQVAEAIHYCEIAEELINKNGNFHNNLIWKIAEQYFSIQSNSKIDDIIVIDSPTLKPRKRNQRTRKIVKI